MTRYFRMYRLGDLSATHDANQANPPDGAQFEGIEFTDGRVAVRWLTEKRSVSVWDSFDDLMAIHGHPEYGSQLQWMDLDPDALDMDNRLIDAEVEITRLARLLAECEQEVTEGGLPRG